MGYRLIQDETLARGLKRIAREEIDSAISELSAKDASRRDHAVHEARKSIKKLRGLLRMLAPVLGSSADNDIAALGDLGRTLSDLRDAAALVETIDMLGRQCRDEHVMGQLSELRVRLRKRARAVSDTSDVRIILEQGVIALRHLKRGTAAWKLEEGFETLAAGLKKSYKRGAKALRVSEEENTAENFHSLRKRVKDRWYQVRVLEGLWAHPGHSPEKALRDLQEDLGDDHNLEELKTFINADWSELSAMVDSLQNHLRHKALKAADDLYRHKPGEVTDHLNSLWKDWRPSVKPAKTAASSHLRSRSAA